MKKIYYGQLNAPIIGLTLKDIMRRAMEEIWKRRIGFVGRDKIVSYNADAKDLVTDADVATQKIFIRKLDECFPGYGIVAEEDFKRDCALKGTKLFFTIDPLDGTKAFGRRQSTGFGPMLSLCTDENIIAAFVGDAMTSELYYYRPESDKVHRLSFEDHQYEQLSTNETIKLSEQHVVLRDNPLNLPEIYRRVAGSEKHGGLFKDIEIQGGGIGVGMARLWKGEIGGYVVKAGLQTPWDLLPVWGISEKLNFICLTFCENRQVWIERTIKPSMENTIFDSPSIFIHRSRLDEFISKTTPQ